MHASIRDTRILYVIRNTQVLYKYLEISSTQYLPAHVLYVIPNTHVLYIHVSHSCSGLTFGPRIDAPWGRYVRASLREGHNFVGFIILSKQGLKPTTANY